MHQTASYHIVGIGLSAGGLEALKEIFRHLPVTTGASFVIIPHLLSGSESHLDKVLAGCTSLQVSWATERAIPQPECVYILPPGQQLSFDGEAFHLVPRQPAKKINHMINRGFTALADAFGRRVIGIILSGMGEDGLEGVKAIEQEGGVVMVQHPETAQFESMPSSIISQDHPDMVATPKQLAQMLMRFFQYQ